LDTYLPNVKRKNKLREEFPDWCNVVDISTAYDLVCGSDGKTYQNRGVASCLNGVTSYTKGVCK
jgi:hypothetical protein